MRRKSPLAVAKKAERESCACASVGATAVTVRSYSSGEIEAWSEAGVGRL